MSAPLQEVSPLLGLVYCAYVVFCVLAVLNVVTGIFVGSAMKAAKDDQDSITIRHLEHTFDVIDESKSGVICQEDFKQHLETKDMQDLFKSIDLDPSEADCVFKLLDLDNTGSLDCDAFLNGCLRLRGNAKSLDLLLLLRETTRQFQKQTTLVQSMQSNQKKQLTEYKDHQERRFNQIHSMLHDLCILNAKSRVSRKSKMKHPAQRQASCQAELHPPKQV
eukprot:TRINITY_DN12918_c0_g1_i1.p2 TRINITY_DN12918_c0_g1~~TRINITY_DN12918_c0_g1_i1.p2  ORF type:complete len:220 (-),score=48.53 TRINITY_DN12918_c0_g1_i1:149-808(-)